MQHSGQVVKIPFPSGLMSTARTPGDMPATFGVEVRNLLLSAEGAGSKRNGFSALGNVIGGQMITGLFGFLYNGVVQVIASVDDGSLRLQQGGGSWTTLISGLNPAGVVRGVTFGGRLVLCNGTDDLLAWDGVTLSTVQEYWVDPSGGLTYVAANQFKINSEVALYPVGRPVRAQLGGTSYVMANVSAVSQSGTVTTVTLDASVLTSALNQVAPQLKPPRFAYLCPAHDRLWAMGVGAIAPTASSYVDRSRVFYSNGFNDVNAWHDETGVVPSINLADKSGPISGGGDEVLAMAVKDDLTVFFGRQVTQVWQGTDPSADGDFAWRKTMPVGVPHAGLVVDLPNDVLFVNAGGARTLSRALQTEQLDVSDVGSEVDPTLRALLRTALGDVGLFRKICHGSYAGQNWFGLLLPGVMPVLQVTNQSRHSGWVLFDGLPASASALATLPDGRLVLAAAGQVYAYDENRWDDAGADVTCRWLTPWLGAPNSKSWANQYVEVLSVSGPQTSLGVGRYTDSDIFNPTVLTLPANQQADFWDSAAWDAAVWDSGKPIPAVVRDHYVAETMAYAVANTDDKALTVYGLKIYGVAES